MTQQKNTFDDKLARYASLLVNVGVGLPEGGKLLVNAPLAAAPLVRLVAREAYRAGALDVRVNYFDEGLILAQYEEASASALGYLPDWAMLEAEKLLEDGYARIAIRGDDPNLLSHIDPDKVAARSKLTAQAAKHISEAIGSFAVNWCVAAMSTPSWAARVYPNLPQDEAVNKLWDDIFAVTRADQTDAVGAWQTHLAELKRICDLLNAKQYQAVHLKSELGTDLTVGLAENHIWQGGAERAKNGIMGVPNMPTDEVFTMPHRDRVEGWAVASKPLSVRGQLIEGIRARFEGGKVVEVTAQCGEEALKKLLDTDEGASHLGEVALVKASAPVAQTGSLFFNTLFDENAASHIAQGRCYSTNVQGGDHPETLAQAGGNDSLIHVDWMIGTAQTDVDGLTKDGNREPLMRAGEWVI